ncbi:MAG: glucose-6-phosphate isomerase [Oscillospiraceae bacterium]|nr:glucose-6-phosphate isomerase [Oscillospiraceae bacterium]
MIKLEHQGLGIRPDEKKAREAYDALISGDCLGSEMRGWLSAPERFAAALDGIERAAERIRSRASALVVVGIGGSYLGAKAALDFIVSPDYNALPKETPDLYFAGTSFSGDGLRELLTMLEGRDFFVNVISKSGTTPEPSAAFRILRGVLEERYGEKGADERIIATTDPKTGVLRRMADGRGWETFEVPGDIGGRYSVLTPVGLLPMAAAGIDVRAALRGAENVFRNGVPDALRYAAIRNAHYEAGKRVELFALMEPAMRSFGEWLKQLFGESGGKEGRGLFPASVVYSTDLHSLGQYVQEGERLFFETFLRAERGRGGLTVPEGEEVGFAAGRSFDELNAAAFAGTKKAHLDGAVPCVSVTIPERSAETFGELAAFFELACAVSCVMSGVNAFDQPGVEAYKRNMRGFFGK